MKKCCRSDALTAAEAEVARLKERVNYWEKPLEHKVARGVDPLDEIRQERDALREQLERITKDRNRLLKIAGPKGGKLAAPGESQEPSPDANKPDEDAPMTPAGSHTTGPEKERRR